MTCKGRRRRGGFTLVELLVVVTIIGILAALLVPAIRGAMVHAQEARIALEVSGMAQALERYKDQMGEYPPDFSGNDGDDQVKVRAHLSRNFRQWDATDANGLTGLDPSEALYFWLRGLRANPFKPLGLDDPDSNNRESFFDFKETQILRELVNVPGSSDLDGDGWPEYVQPGGKKAPYIYFRNDTYATAGWPNDNEDTIASKGVSGFVKPYGASERQNEYCDGNKFQIISAGLSGDFGEGKATPMYPSGGGYQRGDFDNITSFSEGGTLGDKVD